MKKISSIESLTNKYIHSDGSETSIKLLPSGQFDTSGGDVKSTFEDRNKYSIIISASTGCAMSCNFCHITQKESKYVRLQAEQILQNLKDAISEEAKEHPEIANKYIKLCWMGMGEAILISKSVRWVTVKLLDWVMENKYAKGLDGVDIATVMPKLGDGWMNEFSMLNDVLSKYEVNPNNHVVPNAGFTKFNEYKERSALRLFYSLHSTEQETRDIMIPNAMPIDKAMTKIKHFHDKTNVNIVLHYMFMDGINDSEEQIEHLNNFMSVNDLDGFELRILRYNGHSEAIRESDSFRDIIRNVADARSKFKVQFSSGFEVLSACGQFVIDDYSSNPNYFESKAKNNNEINILNI